MSALVADLSLNLDPFIGEGKTEKLFLSIAYQWKPRYDYVTLQVILAGIYDPQPFVKYL